MVGARLRSRFSPPLISATTWSHCHASPVWILRPHPHWQRPWNAANIRSLTRGGTAVSSERPIHSGSARGMALLFRKVDDLDATQRSHPVAVGQCFPWRDYRLYSDGCLAAFVAVAAKVARIVRALAAASKTTEALGVLAQSPFAGRAAAPAAVGTRSFAASAKETFAIGIITHRLTFHLLGARLAPALPFTLRVLDRSPSLTPRVFPRFGKSAASRAAA